MNSLKKTDQLLIATLRTALWGSELPAERFTALTPEEWHTLYKTAAEQGVLALAYDAVAQLPTELHPPRALRLQWAVNVGQIEERYARQERAIAKLAAFYAEHGLRMMLLKGYGLSLRYPQPNHRPCGDADIWLYGRQAEADRLLHEAYGIPIDEEKHHHTVFTFEGVMIENHYDFLNVHAHRSNREIEQQLQALAHEPREVVEVGTATINLPSANFNALFLLRHAAAHFAAVEIGVRHVIDWAIFLKHYHAEVDWPALERMARRMNMHRFLFALSAIAAEWLGLPTACLPPIERDPQLEERVVKEILHPEFAEQPPHGSALKIVWFKYRRWWANRWKHRMVYREGLFSTFWVQVWSHLLKPKSITH